MTRLEIHLRLKSDATFGRGDGVAGLVDSEIEHDEYGLPYMRGRTLKGLLVEECANIFFSLDQQSPSASKRFEEAARYLFGRAGSTIDDDAAMQVGAAMLPPDLCDALINDVKAYEKAKQEKRPREGLTPEEILESLTAIRRQTAIDALTDAPEENSLRSMRVVLRKTSFVSPLNFISEPNDYARALLAACVMSLRRAGTGRNRGRGRLTARLYDSASKVDVTGDNILRFKEVVFGTEAL